MSMSLEDVEVGGSRRRARWEPWEIKTLISIMKDQSELPTKDRGNFFLVEQEMRKHGIERWDSGQIQQKWRKLQREMFNGKVSNYRNSTKKPVSEFQDDLELLATPAPNYSGIDTVSGDEIMGYEVETLESVDHVSVDVDNDDKLSRSSFACSPLPPSEKKTSTSSEEGQEDEPAYQPGGTNKLKKKDRSTQFKKDLFNWPHRAVLLLIKQYKKMEHEFVHSTRRHNKIWNEIAKAINSVSPDLKVTGCQCQQKISGLKRTYFTIKENQNRTSAGNEKITWPYYPIVDKIFSGKTSLNSDVPKKQKKDSGRGLKTKHPSNSSSSDDETNLAAPSSSKSRVEVILEQYIEDVKKHRELLRLKKERRIEEKEHRKEAMERQRMEQRRRMHEERMAMQRAALDILMQILSRDK